MEIEQTSNKIKRLFKGLTVDSLLKIVIIIAILIISLGGFYRYVIYLPAKDKQKTEQETRDKADAERKTQDAAQQAAAEKSTNTLLRNLCLGDAENAYTELWNKNCQGQGLGDDCRLNNSVAQGVEDYRAGLKDECYLKYPVR